MVESLPRLPDLGAPCADSHAHLDMLENPVAALVRAARAGVELVATVVDLTEEPERTLDGLADWQAQASESLEPDGLAVPDVRLVVGWHPHNAKAGDAALLSRMRGLADDPRVGAFGELGLDYHYDHSPREEQRAWFAKQLQLAHEVGLPVQVHLREAHEDGVAMLIEHGVPAAGCVIHCFTEGPALAERYLELGCHISFAGPVTFKSAGAIREAAAIVPLDRLLVETDCPFLAPDPYRGRRNEPAYVVLNAAAVAEASGARADTVAAAALRNVRSLLARERMR